MSVVKPTIDDLLSVTDENRFLLCEMAARRACDINDMMRNQHNRAEQLADVDDLSEYLSDDEGRVPNPLSIAFDEIAPKKDADGENEPGVLSYVGEGGAIDPTAAPAQAEAAPQAEQGGDAPAEVADDAAAPAEDAPAASDDSLV